MDTQLSGLETKALQAPWLDMTSLFSKNVITHAGQVSPRRP